MKNKQKAIEALQRGCQLKGSNVQRNGGGYYTCAIGALVMECGFTFACIRKYEKSHKYKGVSGLPEIQEAIYKKFGLSEQEQEELQDVNDTHDYTDERRKACIKYLDKL